MCCIIIIIIISKRDVVSVLHNADLNEEKVVSEKQKNINRILVSKKVLSGKKCFKNFIRKENEGFWKKYAFVYNAYKNECLPKRF